ncbi:hypothetical protein [Thermovibrio sp.]
MKLFITQNSFLSVSRGILKAKGRGECRIPLKELEGIGLFVNLRSFKTSILPKLREKGIYAFSVLPEKGLELFSFPELSPFNLSVLSSYLFIELKAKAVASALKGIGTLSGSSLEVKPFVSDALRVLREVGGIKGSFEVKSLNGYLDKALYGYLLRKLEYAPFPSKDKEPYFVSLVLYYREVVKGLLGFVLLKEGIKIERELQELLGSLLEPFVAFKSADALFSTLLLPEDFGKRGGKLFLKSSAVSVAVKAFIEGFFSTQTLMPVILYLRESR